MLFHPTGKHLSGRIGSQVDQAVNERRNPTSSAANCKTTLNWSRTQGHKPSCVAVQVVKTMLFFHWHRRASITERIELVRILAGSQQRRNPTISATHRTGLTHRALSQAASQSKWWVVVTVAVVSKQLEAVAAVHDNRDRDVEIISISVQ